MIKIPTRVLKALLICASVEDIRYYLNGIHFDPRGFACATDGHRLLVYSVAKFEGGDFIIPRAAVEAALKMAKATDADTMTITLDHVGDILYKPVEGKYPNWKKVLPPAFTPQPSAYSADHIKDFVKIHKLLTQQEICTFGSHSLHQNGMNPGVVRFSDQCWGLLMPMNYDRTDPSGTFDELMKFADAIPTEPAPSESKPDADKHL